MRTIVDEWLVKGGPSLKILTAGLVRRQAVLDQLASRAQVRPYYLSPSDSYRLREQVAASYQAAATAILSGHFPEYVPRPLLLSSTDYLCLSSLPDQHNFENLNLHDADTEV
jgi:hypothetical protein